MKKFAFLFVCLVIIAGPTWSLAFKAADPTRPGDTTRTVGPQSSKDSNAKSGFKLSSEDLDQIKILRDYVNILTQRSVMQEGELNRLNALITQLNERLEEVTKKMVEMSSQMDQ